MEKRERQSRSDSWQPKWFTLNLQGTVYPDEYGMDDVPCYEWNDTYSKKPVGNTVEDPGASLLIPLSITLMTCVRIGIWCGI